MFTRLWKRFSRAAKVCSILSRRIANLRIYRVPIFKFFRFPNFLPALCSDAGECDKNNIALHTAIDPRTLELTADPDLIEQVLINLMRNAVQALAGRSNARMDLSAQLDGRGRVVIRVQDNGPGILEMCRSGFLFLFLRPNAMVRVLVSRFPDRLCAFIAVRLVFNLSRKKRLFLCCGFELTLHTYMCNL